MTFFSSSLVIKRFIPIFTAFLVFIFLFSIILSPPYSLTFFLFFSILIFVSFFLFLFLVKKNFKNVWRYLAILLLLELSAVLFLIFVKNLTFKIIFIFLLAFLVWIFFEAIFRFFYRPRIYPPYYLENISWFLCFIIAFWFYGAIFALRIFANFSLVLLLLFIFFINFLLIDFIFQLNKIPIKTKSLIYYFIPNLIILELFYTILFLPTAFYVNGFILAILFFLIINILRESLSGILVSKTIKKYLLFASLPLILTIILAKWR